MGNAGGMSRRIWGVLVAALAMTAAVSIMQAGSLAGAWDIAPREEGLFTYAIDRRIGQAAVEGARDAFAAWDEANTDVTLEESGTWADADVRVAGMELFCADGRIIQGCACKSLSLACPVIDNILRGWACPVPAGATIGVASGVRGMDGSITPFAREHMRDLVAHEFGHNLGLEHTESAGHMMQGPRGIIPYSDRGYTVPESIAGGAAPWGHEASGLVAGEWDMPESCAGK